MCAGRKGSNLGPFSNSNRQVQSGACKPERCHINGTHIPRPSETNNVFFFKKSKLTRKRTYCDIHFVKTISPDRAIFDQDR